MDLLAYYVLVIVAVLFVAVLMDIYLDDDFAEGIFGEDSE